MEKKDFDTNALPKEPTNKLRLTDLHEKINAMFAYVYNYGLNVDKDVASLYFSETKLDAGQLTEIYNHLASVVKPAKPATLVMLHKASRSPWKVFGPIPFIRFMSVFAIVALLLLIALSTSTHIDGKSPMYDFAIQDRARLLTQEAFLLAAAALGACFAALFEVNQYVKDGTYEPRYVTSYWVRFILGVMAGFILAMMIPVEAVSKSGDQSFAFGGLLHPLLALIGGYSSSLVYRILNRLVVGLETIFKGSADEQFSKKQAKVKEAMLTERTNEKLAVLNEIHRMVSEAYDDSESVKKQLTDLYDKLSKT
ncbi:MAG: hypothetical protein QNJ17_09745 [Desulfocapsaceae bacterium]|nr:hypothetical protein [Desulfocapsaceae bacterium]